MGIDAPSSDLTGRIRALRKAGVANGDIEPALPGEHSLHGRGGVDVERLSAAHAARDRRATRSGEVAGSDEVVDFVYLEGEEDALKLSPEDGGEAEETQEDPEQVAEFAALPDEVDEPFDIGPENTADAPVEVDPAQSDAVQAELLAKVEEIHVRLDGQDAAFLLIAKAITEASDDHEALAEMFTVLASRFSRPSRWQRFVAWITPR